MRAGRSAAAAIVVASFLVATPTVGRAETPADFIEGYATAVLELGEPQAKVAVENRAGVLRVEFDRRPVASYDTLLRALLEIDGLHETEIYVLGEFAARARLREDKASMVVLDAAATEAVLDDDPSHATAEEDGRDSDDAWDVFAIDELFEPLLADPRWPRFAASHLWYLDDDDLERVGAASFGESFSLVRSPTGPSGQWEFGFQAGVFSVFDLEASSSDLVNSDFLVGLTGTHHLGDFTTLVRIYHQSSHLGDEFLLRNSVNRVNLSFEVIDLLVAFEPLQWLRLYAGGGVIFHREPALDRGIVQTGLQVKSPNALAGGYLRPILAVDIQFREESDWQEDISVRGGVQIEHPFLRRARVQLLGEFYSGRSPNGQFYDERIETIGIGLHLGI